MPDEIQNHDEAMVGQALELLYQHFDTATIFVTRQEPGGMKAKTCGGSFGFGNWYARYGAIVEWVNNGGAMAIRQASDDDLPEEGDGET